MAQFLSGTDLPKVRTASRTSVPLSESKRKPPKVLVACHDHINRRLGERDSSSLDTSRMAYLPIPGSIGTCCALLTGKEAGLGMGKCFNKKKLSLKALRILWGKAFPIPAPGLSFLHPKRSSKSNQVVISTKGLRKSKDIPNSGHNLPCPQNLSSH